MDISFCRRVTLKRVLKMAQSQVPATAGSHRARSSGDYGQRLRSIIPSTNEF